MSGMPAVIHVTSLGGPTTLGIMPSTAGRKGLATKWTVDVRFLADQSASRDDARLSMVNCR